MTTRGLLNPPGQPCGCRECAEPEPIRTPLKYGTVGRIRHEGIALVESPPIDPCLLGDHHWTWLTDSRQICGRCGRPR